MIKCERIVTLRVFNHVTCDRCGISGNDLIGVTEIHQRDLMKRLRKEHNWSFGDHHWCPDCRRHKLRPDETKYDMVKIKELRDKGKKPKEIATILGYPSGQHVSRYIHALAARKGIYI